MIVTAREPDQAAFAPYGSFLVPPDGVGDRSLFSQWLAPLPGLAQQSHLNRVAASTLPTTVDLVEYHPHAAQLFLPIGVSRYLVTVMPSGGDEIPDVEKAKSFVVPGTMGVVYKPGTWHSGIVALDSEASFAVFMLRGADDDDVFLPIEPFEVRGVGDGRAATEGFSATGDIGA